MLRSYKNGQTSIVLRFKLRNSAVTTGAGLTGLTSSSSGLRISTIADNEATATSYTVAGSTIETVSTLGTYAAPTATKCRFKEVDATNHPGLYELHLADARFAVSGAKALLVSISGATNLAECDFLVELTTVDPFVTGGKAPVTLASTDVTGNVASDVQTIKTQTVTCAAGVTVSAYVGTAASSTAQTGDSFARIGANGAGLTAIGDTRLAYLDAAITSRLATASYTVPPSAAVIGAACWADTTGAAVKTSTDKIPASPAAVGSAMQLDLTQVVASVDVTSLTTMTVGQCLAAARAEAAGAESVVSTTYLKKNPDGTTFRSFTLDSATSPTTRS